MARLRGIPQPGTPNFTPALVLLDISIRSNFKYGAFSGLKADSWRRKRKKKQDKKKKNRIQVWVNELTIKKGSL